MVTWDDEDVERGEEESSISMKHKEEEGERVV